MKTINKIVNKVLGKDGKYQKEINVRFPNSSGDSSKTMTIQELKDNHSECLIIDPSIGEQISIEDLANLNIPEVIAMPPLQGG